MMTWVRTVPEREAEGVADALEVELNKEYATLQKADVSGVTQ